MLHYYRNSAFLPSIIFVLFFIGMPFLSISQFQMNGSASQTSCNCYQLTPDITWQAGSVWNVNLIDLNQPFDFNFEMFLGCDDGGADGMVFALQSVGVGVGTNGNGMGLGGVSPSFGVFFDTFQNVTPDNDPFADHVSINSNGNVNHDGGPNDLAGPVVLPNIEDCNWHDLQVVWDPATTTFQVYMDGALYITYVGDIINTIFGGNPNVYWGFTSATGGLDNHHNFCTKLEADFIPSSPIGCPGDVISFADTSESFGVITNWDWDFGDGNTATGANVSHTFNNLGTFDVTLTITDGLGCTDSYVVPVTIGTPPMSVSATPQDLCVGESAQLLVQPGVPSTYTYSWSPAGTLNQTTITDPVASPSSSTTYYVSITDENSGCTGTDSIEVNVYEIPEASIFLTANFVCAPFDMNFENNSTNATTFYWDFGNGSTATVNDLSTQVSVMDQNTVVTLIASNNDVCFDTTQAEIFILDCGCTDPLAVNYNPSATTDDGTCQYPIPTVVAPNVFTPNGDQSNDFYELDVMHAESVNLIIVNRWGNVMYEATGTNPKWDGTDLSGAEANEGTYFYKYLVTGSEGDIIEGHGFLELMR